MKKRNLLSVIILLTVSLNTFSQIGVTSYSIYSLGLNTSKDRKISGELKLFLNHTGVDDSFAELSAMYNFKPHTYHQFSIGLGVGGLGDGYLINSFTLPIQLEIYPLQSFKRFSVVFEVTPTYSDEFHIRQLWGIKYSF